MPIDRIMPDGQVQLQQSSRKSSDKSIHSIIRFLNRLYRNHDISLMVRFLEIIKLAFVKISDELEIQTKAKTKPEFVIGKRETKGEVYNRIKKMYQRYIAQNGLQELPLISSEDIIYKTVSFLQNFSLLSFEQDVKGLIFEELIKNTFEKDENQQYFTPRMLVDFLVEIIDPNVSQVFCDPACGTGGFLTRTLTKIRGDLRKSGIPDVEGSLRNYSSDSLIGVEVDSNLAWISQMSLLLNSGVCNSIHYLPDGGSLGFNKKAREILKPDSIDVIITNPPFGSDYSEVSDLEQYVVGKGKKSVRRGILFIEKCICLLRRGGKLAIIIDDSVLNGPSNKDIREYLLKKCVVRGVISLPEETFSPYATVKSSILIVEQKKTDEEEQNLVFFADVRHIGKKPNGQPLYSDIRDEQGNLRLLNDLPQIAEAWKQYSLSKKQRKEWKYCFLADIELFSKNNPDLRLDIRFHDPRKRQAFQLLQNTPHPVIPLSRLMYSLNEVSTPSKDFPDQYVNYIGLANMEKETGNYEIQVKMGEKLRSNVRKFLPNSILFSKLRPELRKVAYCEGDEGYCSSECLVFLPLNNRQRNAISKEDIESRRILRPAIEIDMKFLSIILRSDLVYGQLVHQVTGIGRPRISRKVIMNIRIPVPPIEIQNRFVHNFEETSRKSNQLKEESKELLSRAKICLKDGYAFIQEELCKGD